MSPLAPRRPCLVPDCAQLQPCPHHTTRAPLYNRRPWRRLSQQYLAAHPWCAECQREQRLTLATQVDHIEPHRGDQDLFWDDANWQGLCHGCHSRKTQAGG